MWVRVCSTLLLCVTLRGLLFWEAQVDLCNGPVQTAPKRERARVCVWAHVCMCTFACINKDMGYCSAFVLGAGIARVVISWADKLCMNISVSLGAIISVLFVLQSWWEVGTGLRVHEIVAKARLCCLLFQGESKLGTQLSPRWPGLFSSGSLVPPTLLPCFHRSWRVRLAHWALRWGCGRMAQGHAQQPPRVLDLVLQRTQELEWWNEEEARLAFLYTCFVGPLKLSRIPWFCRSFHVTLMNAVPGGSAVSECPCPPGRGVWAHGSDWGFSANTSPDVMKWELLAWSDTAFPRGAFADLAPSPHHS